jgi:hypothetical protein
MPGIEFKTCTQTVHLLFSKPLWTRDYNDFHFIDWATEVQRG